MEENTLETGNTSRTTPTPVFEIKKKPIGAGGESVVFQGKEQITNEDGSITTGPKSVVKVPAGYNFNLTDAVNSTVQTVNGYDNFFLGTDFGEPHIATNPRNPLNSICAFNTKFIASLKKFLSA